MILAWGPSRGRVAAATGVALLFCPMYSAGYLSLHGDQLWVFQRIMGVIGLGLLVIFTIGKSLSFRALRALNGLDGWIQQRPSRASVLLVVFILTYVVLWCGVSFLRHYYFHSSYDLSILNQVVWNTAQGNFLSRSIEVAHDLGDHVRPYLAVLSLLYLFIPSPYVLLTFQSLVLALSAWPLYRLARRKFDSPAIGLAAALCLLAYPPLGFLNRNDFHSEVLSIPLLIAAYERIDVADLKRASLLIALTLFTKENLGLTVAALGIMAGLSYKQWRFGLSWAVVGLAYSLIALLVVIPAFRGEPSDTLARYHWLGDTPGQMLWTMLSQPGVVSQKILAAGNILTLLQLLAPLAFLPLLGLPALLPTTPALIYNFLSEWPPQTTIYNQYMAPVVPFLPIAAVMGLHRLMTSSWGARLLDVIPMNRLQADWKAGLGVSMMLVATPTSWIYQNPITGNGSLLWATVPEIVPLREKTPVPLIWSNDAAIREGLRQVPGDVSVFTTTNYAPHLSHRPQIEMIPRAPVSIFDPEPEVIFLNLRDLRWWSCDDYFENLKAAASSNFGVIFYRDDVLLLQKDKGDAGKLKDLLNHWRGCQ
jgi:uncharacterized membrane protein